VRKTLFFFAVIGFTILLMQPGRASTQGSATPAPTMAATEPATDLGGGLRLESRRSTETIKDPALTIEIKQPLLAGATGAQVDTFNKAVDEIVKKTTDDFKANLTEMQSGAPATLPPDLPGSSIDINYKALTATDRLISIRFDVGFYARGAAHPSQYFVPLNYDVKAGKVLALADLFQPTTKYLQTIADYTVKDLKTKGFMDFPEGAEPTEENYRNWNIQKDGLLISFDPAQVAPHAAGPQEVVVPYSALKSMIKADGPLAQYIK
jgi:hypothetical protein